MGCEWDVWIRDFADSGRIYGRAARGSARQRAAGGGQAGPRRAEIRISTPPRIENRHMRRPTVLGVHMYRHIAIAR